MTLIFLLAGIKAAPQSYDYSLLLTDVAHMSQTRISIAAQHIAYTKTLQRKYGTQNVAKNTVGTSSLPDSSHTRISVILIN